MMMMSNLALIDNPHESSKKQSVVDVIERFIRGKTAEECRRKFDYDLSVGFIKVRKDQIPRCIFKFSNPATYTGIFDYVRSWFAEQTFLLSF